MPDAPKEILYKNALLWAAEIYYRLGIGHDIQVQDQPPLRGFWDATDNTHHLIRTATITEGIAAYPSDLWQDFGSDPARRNLVSWYQEVHALLPAETDAQTLQVSPDGAVSGPSVKQFIRSLGIPRDEDDPTWNPKREARDAVDLLQRYEEEPPSFLLQWAAEEEATELVEEAEQATKH